jgi:hypothetical protein
VIPEVAAFLHRDAAAGAPYHQDLLAAFAFLQGFIGIRLERNLLAAAQAFIGGDDEFGPGVIDAAGFTI